MLLHFISYINRIIFHSCAFFMHLYLHVSFAMVSSKFSQLQGLWWLFPKSLGTDATWHNECDISGLHNSNLADQVAFQLCWQLTQIWQRELAQWLSGPFTVIYDLPGSKLKLVRWTGLGSRLGGVFLSAGKKTPSAVLQQVRRLDILLRDAYTHCKHGMKKDTLVPGYTSVPPLVWAPG